MAKKSAKPRAPKARPSFGGAAGADSSATGWVYRSDKTQATPATTPAPKAPAPVVPVAAAVATEPPPARKAVTAPPTASAPPRSFEQKESDATEIVRRYALYAAGAGLIPLPLVDFGAVSVISLKMTAEIAEVYSVEFSDDLARPIIASIVGSYLATRVGYGAGIMLMKAVPVIGPLVGGLTMPAFAAGLTWAIGKVFIMQFASGGTFLDLSPERLRKFFASARL